MSSRSEATRTRIAAAAAELFNQKGYDAVTMREIASAAGCSHASIHSYYRDKETLLLTLSLPLLEEMDRQMEELRALPSRQALLAKSLLLVSISLQNRNLVPLMFEMDTQRVDAASPRHRLDEVRQNLFDRLSLTLSEALGGIADPHKRLLASRIYYYMLYGVVSTYRHSRESKEQLMARLEDTFTAAFQSTLSGIASTLQLQGNEHI